MPWQPSERAVQARQRSSQGCDYWKSYASSKRWLPRSTGCKPGRLVKDGRAGHSLSRSPHGTTSRRSPPAGATGPGAGWCSWPFAASCTSGGWATRPASRGSGYQCRGSLHSGTKSATRKSAHTPSGLFLRHGGHISGNTDLDTCKYDSRWSREEGRCYKRCSSKWCNIGTSQKLPGTASRSLGPCPGGIKAESCEGCKSGAAGGHRPSPDITGRHRQDGHYQQKSTCHGRWGTADGWPEMWRGDWSNPSHSGPRMHGRQCRRSQQPCSLGGIGTTPNHRETTLTPPAPARQMRGQMRQTRKRQRQGRWSCWRNSMMSLKERRDRRSRRVWVLRLRTPRWSQLLMTLLLQQATADLLRSMWYTLWSMTRMMVVT